ncbi:MAG: toprim domain-containing protein [Synergistaceae bacterium]|nr:toprim domain-containing protein [Synergistaceae bacterium]
MNSKNASIFSEVQDRYNIVGVAESLGLRLHKVGSSFRADSIAGTGDGKDAFSVYPKDNTWYDFMLKIGGDITDLVAHVKYNGDKGAALRELMPEWTSEKVKVQISQREKFMQDIERWHNELLSNKTHCVKAREYLHSRKITDETIKKLKIGVQAWNGTFRILFPYWDESMKNVLYYTTRCYDWSGRGVGEKEAKYMKASLQANPFLKNTAWGLHTLNRNSDEIWITEGMFDALHLAQAGLSVLATNGGDFGKEWPKVIEKIGDFKKVILAFDNDEHGKSFTYNSAQVLIKNRVPFEVANFILKDVAEHFENGGTLKNLQNSTVNGLRWTLSYIAPKKPLDELTVKEREKAKEKCKDFVMNVAPFTDNADMHDMLMTLRLNFSKDWLSEVFKQAKKGLSDIEVCEIIKQNHLIIHNARTGFYEYNAEKGIWEHQDNEVIEGYICTIYGRHATGGKIASTIRTFKAYKGIQSDIPLTKFNTLPCVTFLNGTLHIDIHTGKAKLLPYSPSDYTTVRISYFFNPDAKGPKWQKFLEEVMNGRTDCIRLLQEFSGYSLLPDCRFQKALLLLGRGSNGKSVFTDMIKKALGDIKDGHGYISATEPSRFSKDFRLMSFKNSWLNISSDIENDLRGGEGVFKKISAGEMLEDSYKGKDVFAFPTRAKLMMCSNDFPKTRDTSEGFMRRWLIVNFDMHYAEGEDIKANTNDRLLNPNLEAELTQELPAIFNWILAGLQRLLAQNGFTRTSDHKKIINSFMCTNNPMMAFAEDEQENFYEDVDENGVLKGKAMHRKQVYLEYRKHAEESCEIPVSAKRFYNNFKSIAEQLGIEFEEKGRIWIFKDVQKEVKAA